MEPTSQQESNEKPRAASTWLVIAVTGLRYIANVAHTKEEVLAIAERGGLLCLIDSFEFHCQTGVEMVRGEGGMPAQRISKNLLTLRPDATLYQMRSYQSTAGANIYFLDDLVGTDPAVYKDQLQQASNMAQAWQKERAAQTSGLIVTPNMPKVPMPGAFPGNGRA